MTEPNFPWTLLGSVVLLAIAGVVTFSYTTKAGVIARATTKEAVRQPVFLLCLAISIVFLMLSCVVPFFTLGEDVKVLKDCGLGTLLITSILIAVWTASSSIADEIEGKTAMTLLSKPINRQQFIVGKFVGIVQALFLYLLPLTIVFVALIFYKDFYDSRESSKEAPQAIEAFGIAIQIVPGVLLTFFEVVVLTAVSVAISTRLPLVVNLSLCLVLFVIGHLIPVLVEAGAVKLEFVAFMARFLATILPTLEHFNIQAAVATGTLVPIDYLAYAALFCLSYSTAAILLAFTLFEDRDLA